MLTFQKIYFIKDSLKYQFGYELYEKLKSMDKDVEIISTTRGVGINGDDSAKIYNQSKRTLVVSVRRAGKFETCKPSAHYQLPLVSGCTGMCEYCYLSTRTGVKPISKLYANIEDIFEKAKAYIAERQEKTIFEAAASSDPVVFEPFSGVLTKAVEFFANQPNARLRFATKFTDIDTLIPLNHNGKTEIRFSVNTDSVVDNFEHNTPSVNERLIAAKKVLDAGYNTGFMIAPVILHKDWQEEYKKLIDKMYQTVGDTPITIEIVTHRFTANAKNTIEQIFPNTSLVMNEDERRFKYGQFGYGKYVYRQDDMKTVKEFFEQNISIMKNARILYVV